MKNGGFMKKMIVFTALLLLVLTGCEMLVAPQHAKGLNRAAFEGTILINEFVANHTGTDTYEYIELFGTPATSFSSLTLIELEGDSSGAGTIDGVFPVGTTDENGYWLAGPWSNELENGSITMLLVENFTGSIGDDLDTDNDGVLDMTPWTDIIDSLAVSDGGSSDQVYGDLVLERGYDGNSFTVGGASRYPNGKDTGSTSDFRRNDYDGAGLPGFSGTPDEGEAQNTPGSMNLPASPTEALEVSIMEIQGSSFTSPFENVLVKTTGTVTMISGDGRSFWMQDLVGDGDRATSDGIYVYRANAEVLPGDLVEVEGIVKEYRSGSRPQDLTLTEISPVESVTILPSDKVLPQAVELSGLPKTSIEESKLFWESLEGMLVSMDKGWVVGSTNYYGEAVLVSWDDARRNPSFAALGRQLMLTSSSSGEVDYNPERIMIDDSIYRPEQDLQTGDMVRNLYGVVDYSFSNFKVQVSRLEHIDLPRHSRSFVAKSWRDLHVVNFNVENLFDLLDDPDKDDGGSTPSAEELEIKLSKLTLAVADELRFPDILVVQETENEAILQTLADRINTAYGTSYSAVGRGSSDGRGIENAFLFRTDRVELANAYLMSGPEIEAAFGPESTSPGREPLVGEFVFRGRSIYVIGNHLKSKGGDGPLYGTQWPVDRTTEVQRKAQAEALRNGIDEIFASDPDAYLIVSGDMNDFQFAEPGEGSHPLGIIEGDAPKLYNIIYAIPFYSRYTYIYEGNSQVLDHMLLSPTLVRKVRDKDILHFNAAFVLSYEADPATALRSSDHDAVSVVLRFW
jgi:predicted extracellular nuclease